MSPEQLHRVRTDDGVHLAVRTSGPADASTTVVLVHGFAATMGEFDALRPLLPQRCRVVDYDQRGHGESERGDLRDLDLDRLGRDLAAVVEQQVPPTSSVVLVGHSMGGMAILALARREPRLFGARVTAVALLSTAARPLGRAAALPGLLGRIRHDRLLRPYLAALQAVAGALDRLRPVRLAAVRRLLGRRLFAHRRRVPEAERLLRRWFSRTPTSVELALAPSCAFTDQSPALRCLARVPTLVLTGARDRSIAARHSDRLARALGPAARLVRVPGAGHMVDLTHPAEVHQALLPLLRPGLLPEPPRSVTTS